ncbi:MAG: RNA polymerase sigma factor [Chitinophagales bacterium]|nr:RNA polymerase sigma factor [Chitinophagales bacterium]
MNQISDTDLIDSVIAGDQSAFGALVKRHQRYVFTLALKFVKRREDAEEIAQDSFVKAYKSLATFQKQSKFTTWLYGIVYHTSMTFLRKKNIEKVSIDDDENFLQIENKDAGFNADKAEKKSRTEYVQMAIKMLLPDDALIISLFYQNEQSLEEIAAITGYETNTAKVKLHRARLRLKDKLDLLLKEEVKDLIH